MQDTELEFPHFGEILERNRNVELPCL